MSTPLVSNLNVTWTRTTEPGPDEGQPVAGTIAGPAFVDLTIATVGNQHFSFRLPEQLAQWLAGTIQELTRG